MTRQPGTQHPLQAEKQHVDQARYNRRDGKWQIDQGDQQTLADKLKFADAPGGSHPKHEIQRHGDARRQQRQPDRSQRVGLTQARPIGADPFGQSLGEDDRQRQEDEEPQKQYRHADQDPAHCDGLAGCGSRDPAGCRKFSCS